MSRRGLVALALLLLAVPAAGAIVFPWAVRSRVSTVAGARGLVVDVGSVRPRWGGVELGGVRVALSEGKVLEGQIERVRVDTSLGGELRGVEVTGGMVKLSGEPEAVRQALESRGSRQGGSGGEGKGARIEVSGVALSWEHEGQRVLVRGAGLTKDGGTLVLRGEEGTAEAKGVKATVVGGEARLEKGDGGYRLSSIAARELSIEAEVPEEAKGEAGRAVEAAAEPAKVDEGKAPQKVVGKGGAKRQVKAGAKAAEAVVKESERKPHKVEAQAKKAKGQAHQAASLLRAALGVGGKVSVDKLTLLLKRGGEQLHVGPGKLGVDAGEHGVGVSLTPGGGDQGQTPLMVEAQLPYDTAANLSVKLQGGPVTLAMLGVHEGDLGLFDVGKSSIEASGRVHLTGDGGQVEVDLEGKVRGLSIRQAKLSSEPVQGLSLGFAVKASSRLDGSRVEVAKGLLEAGSVQVELSGLMERGEEGVTLAGKVDVPLASCQGLLDALPAGLSPRTVGMKASGTFAAQARVVYDERRAAETQVDFRLVNECRITQAPPEVAVVRLRQPFRRKVYAPDGSRVEIESGPGSAGWVSLGGIASCMEGAVMTTEDGGFRRHRGFDLEAIRNSIRENLKAKKFLRGASTISMQLAKNLYLDRGKTLGRKLEEAILTTYLEQELTKEQILELYLNSIEFGPMIYGIGPAAAHYFRTTAAELSVGQCLYLSSILPNPKVTHFGADGRVTAPYMGYLHRLMRHMEKRGFIRSDELEDGLSEWVVFGQPRPAKKEKGMEEGEPLPDEVRDGSRF